MSPADYLLSNLNTIVIICGWILGGLVVVIGMRTQVNHLATELSLLRATLLGMTTTVNKVATDVAYLQGLVRGRQDMLQEHSEARQVVVP